MAVSFAYGRAAGAVSWAAIAATSGGRPGGSAVYRAAPSTMLGTAESSPSRERTSPTRSYRRPGSEPLLTSTPEVSLKPTPVAPTRTGQPTTGRYGPGSPSISTWIPARRDPVRPGAGAKGRPATRYPPPDRP